MTRGNSKRSRRWNRHANGQHEQRHRLRFGIDAPPPELPSSAGRRIEAGWHPVCGHVRHLSTNDRLEGLPSLNLVYGLLTRREIAERTVDCDTCRPPEQAELAL